MCFYVEDMLLQRKWQAFAWLVRSWRVIEIVNDESRIYYLEDSLISEKILITLTGKWKKDFVTASPHGWLKKKISELQFREQIILKDFACSQIKSLVKIFCGELSWKIGIRREILHCLECMYLVKLYFSDYPAEV